MKAKITAIALFLVTAGAVAYYPALQGLGNRTPTDPGTILLPPVDPTANERPRVDVVFALDTTGSMSGLIQAAKEKIWSIASSMASAQPAPEIRMGLVAYRDRGDAYVTRRVDLSEDLDSVYAQLMDFRAQGGGDGPESVNQALRDAVHRMSWGQDPKAYKVIFLVGDAPPHTDYPNDVQYPEILAAARERGIVINTVQCGKAADTSREWQRIAALGKGNYFQVDQGGSAVAMDSPFDKRMAELSAKLDKTRLYYGSDEAKAVKREKLAATEKLHEGASVASQARRAAFNTSESGEANLFGDGELVEDIAAGRVDLDSLAPEALPEPMQAMSPAEQATAVAETAEKRQALRDEIRELAGKRDAFLAKKVEEVGGARESLDHKIYRAVREQSAPAGLHYEAEAPSY